MADFFDKWIGVIIISAFGAAIISAVIVKSNEKCHFEKVQEVSCISTGGFFGGMRCSIKTENYYLKRYSVYLKNEPIKICE